MSRGTRCVRGVTTGWSPGSRARKGRRSPRRTGRASQPGVRFASASASSGRVTRSASSSMPGSPERSPFRRSSEGHSRPGTSGTGSTASSRGGATSPRRWSSCWPSPSTPSRCTASRSRSSREIMRAFGSSKSSVFAPKGSRRSTSRSTASGRTTPSSRSPRRSGAAGATAFSGPGWSEPVTGAVGLSPSSRRPSDVIEPATPGGHVPTGPRGSSADDDAAPTSVDPSLSMAARNRSVRSASVLAVHASWNVHDDALLLWAEDGELPASAPRRPGRRPASPAPAPHPFAVPAASVLEALGGLGAFAGVSAETSGAGRTQVLWLPGTPAPSTDLVRAEPTEGTDGEQGDASGGTTAAPRRERPRRTRLSPFLVPVVQLEPGVALDVLLAAAMPDSGGPTIRFGASVAAFSAVAELALEVVAGGRVLPDLTAEGGRHVARWTPLGGGADGDRARMLAAALPPVSRAVDAVGADPAVLVRAALGGFVDAVCREALRRSRDRPSGGGATPARAVDAWIAALSTRTGVVEADAGELSKLERLVAEWRAGAVGRGGPWRLCFRVREPEDEVVGSARSEADAHVVGAPAGPWRVELLLQATDDPSLVVEAPEVWRSADVLRRATRTLEEPHEVLLAELGRALRAFPDLASVLREAAPVAVEMDLADAHRFLSEVAPVLEVSGFGVLLPSWWRSPATRLGLRLRSSSSISTSSSGLLTGAALAEFDWHAALGDHEIGLRELRRLAQLKQPLVRVRGQWAELRPEEVAKLAEFLSAGRRSKQQLSVADVLRLAAGAPGAAPLDGVPVVGVDADGVLGAMLRGDLEAAIEVRPTPAGFQGELRPYQARGVAWIELLERLGLGACLADDMGLGKTAMVLAVLQAERAGTSDRHVGRRARQRVAASSARGPTLVICPTSVVGNWEREATRFAPDLRVV